MARAPHFRLNRRSFLSLTLGAPGLLKALQNASSSPPQIRFLRYEDVETILRSGAVRLPPDLDVGNVNALRTAWPGWVQRQDASLKSRLQRGEEDTLANFVLFGSSFTAQPRLTLDLIETAEFDSRMRIRIQNFVDAVAAPGSNERLQQLNVLIRQLGYSAAAGEDRERLTEYVTQNIERYLVERQSYEATAAKSQGNDTASSFSATSEIYKDRGLSLDTDFRPNYAIEAGLSEARRRGLLKAVRRVAIVGPGLDFTDKDSGFDHYPLQTLQSFSVVDSLLKLGLARANDLRVSLFDVSSAVLDHVQRAVERARAKQSYTIQLVLNRSRSWDRRVMDYWLNFGSRIGSNVPPLALPPQVRLALDDVRTRAVRVRPEIVALMEPVRLNAVLQRSELPPERAFDLVIATNILVYYSAFEQALALSNVDSMLAPNGIFLTNDLAREFPGVRLRPTGVVNASYASGRTDQIHLFARSAFQPQLPPQ